MRYWGNRVAAAALAVTVLAGACSSSSGFEQVEESPREDGVPLPTTTLVTSSIPGTAPAAADGASTEPAATAAAAAPDTQAALASMIGQLATEPGLIAAIGQLPNADVSTLAAIFGLDEQVLAQLELTLAEVQGIAAMIAGIDAQRLAEAFGAGLGSSLDMSAVQGLLAIASRLDAAAIAAADGLTRQVIGSVVSALAEATEVVDPALVALFSALLEHFDPSGLGALAAKPSTASVLAVFTAASLRVNPQLESRLEPYVRADADLAALVRQLDQVGRTLSHGEASALAAVASQLTPQGLLGISQLVTVLDAPTTQHLFARLGI